jgi:hypothetical protein
MAASPFHSLTSRAMPKGLVMAGGLGLTVLIQVMRRILRFLLHAQYQCGT